MNLSIDKAKKLVLFLFLGVNLSCFSQSVLKGRVTDSLQKPLPYTNVIAKPQDSLKKLQFSITNEQGEYRLELDEIPYTVTASYMGYQPYNFKVLPIKTVIKDIILKENAEELEEVVIELPIVVKKDTILYTVEKLLTGEERKLKDVLKKLPGVEVGKDGSVTVQGKKVTTMLVENRKFFGGGSKLAVENIPAGAIHQVEVIDNYNEVAFLKNLVDSEEMAMNIKLKEDKKKFIFGDIEAGKGDQDFYRTHSNLFYYSPKTSLNAIGNLNNIADEVFTYRQYLDFQTGINQIFKIGGTIFNTPDDDFLQFLESNDVVSGKREFGALNISTEVNNKLNISGYGLFSATREETFTESINIYNNTFTETKELSSNTKNIFAIGNINISYLPNLTDQWYLKTQLKNTDNQYRNVINSRMDTISSMFLTDKEADGVFFNQSVEWHRKSSKEHTFSFAVDYTFKENEPRTFWETSDAILEGLIPVVEDSIYRLSQLKKVKNNSLDAIFKHYWVIDKNNHIYATIGDAYLKQSFFTEDRQELTDGSSNNFNGPNFGNDLDFNLNDFYFGLHYKFKAGIFTFDQGAFMHYYNWKVEQQVNITDDKVVILPSFSVKAEINQLKKVQFKYDLKTAFSDASEFAKRYYLQSYNSVYVGNESLENELYHNFNLHYSKFSGYQSFRLYLIANYVRQIKGIKNAIDYYGVNQSVTPVLLDNPETRWSFYGNIKKKIKDINFTLGLRYNTSKYLQQVNNTLEENKNNSFLYSIAAKTLFEKFPTIEVGFRQSTGNYTLSGNTSRFITSEPFLTLDYDFLKGFIASFDYTSYKYINKSLNQQNRYEIANVSMYYKEENSAWSFKLESQNLFNVKFKNQNSFSSYIISDSKTYILPRIVMFSIGYNL